MSISRSSLHAAAVATAVVSLGLTAPQASAVNAAEILGVRVSASADAGTHAIAAADPQAVQAAANLCGSGYSLNYAERLPDERRFGTLFTYENGRNSVCAIFDNNLGVRKYMKLKLCDNRVNGVCKTDEGNFTQYAGPVRITSDAAQCSKVTAIMKDSASSNVAIIDRVTTATHCN
ncbi:hypothetical protein CUT44_18720 [Streptomyces carminius]|uniref:Spore-associated protein A n=1 Tax=Streptomyces carminius TaxID=2665496 RepID=A0A2M8LX60_9ACTN|nr:hypothetical protein [Streptomyces carminius]PJE96519.1 hypothetical protein CUT44_18720 [Streptomyces carminius]